MRNRVMWYKSERSDWFGINYHIDILVYRDINTHSVHLISKVSTAKSSIYFLTQNLAKN